MEVTPNLSIRIETVHRINGFGVVLTNTSQGTSLEGFDAEWRMIQLLTVEGDQVSRLELFDEADLDAALARLEELQPQARRLRNAASQVCERFRANFAAGDWQALKGTFATDFSIDDRRRVVNAGIRHGGDAEIEDLRAAADLGLTYMTFEVIATRGERLILGRGDADNIDQPGSFAFDVLQVVEVDADGLMTAVVVFDADDIDSATTELDTRYFAGEAATYAHTWALVAGGYAASNRRELPATTPDWVNVDHRRAIAFAPGELAAYMHATWDLAPDVKVYIEAVHRLSNLGAVVTQALRGTSDEGFEAEWREITLVTIDGDLINRVELFDEEDIDAALARFDELSWPTPRLENAASQVGERVQALFMARNWDAIAEILDEDISVDDRRRVVSAPTSYAAGDVEIANMRALAEMAQTNVSSDCLVATSGGAARPLFRVPLLGPRPATPRRFNTDPPRTSSTPTPIAGLRRHVVFDPVDIDAAFDELDARYLQAKRPSSRTWSSSRIPTPR